MAERRISEDFLRELRDKNEISEVISSYVNLRRHGSTMKGLCPFHNEKTPSFTVYLDTQSFYCFGCGAGGDVVTFIRRIENLGYLDAIKSLAQRANMALPEDHFDDGVSNRRRRILAANRDAARFFHECLVGSQGRACLDYLLNRGYTMSTVRHFGMGYAPDGWHTLCDYLHGKGYTMPELVDANLARKSEKNGKVNSGGPQIGLKEHGAEPAGTEKRTPCEAAAFRTVSRKQDGESENKERFGKFRRLETEAPEAEPAAHAVDPRAETGQKQQKAQKKNTARQPEFSENAERNRRCAEEHGDAGSKEDPLSRGKQKRLFCPAL